jgi:hypothetical protein
MRQNTKVTFAMRDLDRLKCIQAVVDGDLKPIRAADRLGLTTRQVRRLAHRYATAGPAVMLRLLISLIERLRRFAITDDETLTHRERSRSGDQLSYSS